MENDQIQPIQTLATPLPPVITPLTVSVPPKPSQLPIAILSMLSLIFLSGIVYFYFQIQSLKQQLVDKQPAIPTLTTSPTPSTTTDPTNNWQVYNDAKNKLTFKYPNDWKLITTAPNDYKKTTNPGYFLYKADPKTECGKPNGNGGGGPCGNSTSIQFRFGKIDQSTPDFDQDFWGVGFPIDKTDQAIISRKEVVRAYTTETRYPYANLYKIDSTNQLFVTSEFFPQTAQDNHSQFAEDTIQEINQILSTIQFEDLK